MLAIYLSVRNIDCDLILQESFVSMAVTKLQRQSSSTATIIYIGRPTNLKIVTSVTRVSLVNTKILK